VSIAQTTDAQAKETMTLNFRGSDFVHRWSKDGQNEFTPRSDSDLATWRDMITVNVHESVANGDQLAELANRILTNFQRRGKILRTDSKPRTVGRPAEHLIVAVLGDPNFLEAAFARCALVNGVGLVTVYSHRVYGQAAGPATSEWLKINGSQVEKTLMDWEQLPSAASLKRLPQSK
jgi:threonine dehydrogenase-like Zn-dependent dehydrogenase